MKKVVRAGFVLLSSGKAHNLNKALQYMYILVAFDRIFFMDMAHYRYFNHDNMKPVQL